jgi:peptide/nickel transport system permease protein
LNRLLARLLLMVPTFVGITALTFAVSRLAPGDPLGLERPGSAAAIAEVARQEGRDRPGWEQYGRWALSVARLELGRSSYDQQPVREKIAAALPATASLCGSALVGLFALALPLGLWCARRPGGGLDRSLRALMVLFAAVPSFAWAVLLLLLFATPRGWMIAPLQGGWALPVACLIIAALPTALSYLRAAMLEALEHPAVRTARSKGLSEREVLWRHALRLALGPVFGLLAVMLPWLVSGSVVVEEIFGRVGMGTLAVESILRRDHPTVMGVTVVVALVTLLSVLAADLLHAWADPRLTATGERR